MVAREDLVIRVPEAIYVEMVAHVVEGYPHEACGALGTKEGRVVKHYPTANAAKHPDDFSIIDPQDLLHIYEDIDDYDGEMIYYPSQRDKEWAKRNKLYYIIFSHQYYPEPPYTRVFSIYDDESVVEGKIEMV